MSRLKRAPQGPNISLLSPLPPPSPIVGLLPIPNLKKKMKEKEIAKEGEVVPQKEPKQQKTAKDKGQSSLVESRED